MRFTSVAAGAVAVFASVHGAGAQTTASPTVSVSPAQTSAAACLKDCESGDVECQSHCIAVPAPDEDQANATTECIANCPQGDGSEAETAQYASCIDKCINDNFYVTSTGTPASPTDSSGSGSGSDDDDSSSDSGSDATTTASGSETTESSGSSDEDSDSSATETTAAPGESSGSATGSAASETPTDDAAPALVASGAAAFGIFAAVLAL